MDDLKPLRKLVFNVAGEEVTILDYGDGLMRAETVVGWLDAPETKMKETAAALALEQAIKYWKAEKESNRNKENSSAPRGRRMQNPTPDEVLNAMRLLKQVESDGTMRHPHYRKKLLHHLNETYPALDSSALDRRTDELREDGKIRKA